MNRPVGFAATVLLISARAALGQTAPEVLVDVTRNGRPIQEIYEGQSIDYDVTLNHVENPSPPKLEGFDDFDVQRMGEQSLDSTRVTIINGQMTKVVRRGRLYRYQLTPRKTGVIRIPAPVATVDGQVLRGPETTLRVIPAEDQDVAFLEIACDRQSVYPMQTLTVTLSVAVKGLAPPFVDRDPVSVQRDVRYRQPALRIPWIGDESQLPDGLAPEDDLNRWARPLLSNQRAGFSINGLTTRGSSIFSLFDDQEVATFLPGPRKIVRRDNSGQDRDYWLYEFPRAFVPSKVGQYTFGPVTLEGAFVTQVDGQGQAKVEQVYAAAKPIRVTVKDVPQEGRPETFVGAVGQFQIAADLEPKRAKVRDPMTFTLSLTGRGTLESVTAPDLAQMPEVAGRFKVYEATEETKADSCRFTYGLRPLEEGIDEFPPIAVSYFDVESERYVTLRTDAIPIEVTKAERLTDDQIVAMPGGASQKRRELQARDEGIIIRPSDPDEVRNESVHPGRWLLGLAGMAGLYVLVAVATVQVQRLSADKALLRRRAAPAKARGRLEDALAELRVNRTGQGADLVQDSLVGLVADVADLPEAGLTPKDVREQLETFGVEEDLVRRVGRLLETCDAARYGSAGLSDGLSHEAQQVLDELIRSLKARKRFR